MSNITMESELREPRKIKFLDKKWINRYLKENFGENVAFDYDEKMLKLCENEVLSHPKFISLLKKFRFWIMPSLF